LIIIKHNETFLSAYAHTSKILVEENNIVKKGQIIANLGDTDSIKPILHFQIRKNGKPVDPEKYLP
jgi:lipoprotein NlpD